jgi:hypothetical protein
VTVSTPNKKLASEMLIDSEALTEQQKILREVASILYDLACAAAERGVRVAPYFQRLAAIGLGMQEAALEPPERPALEQ